MKYKAGDKVKIISHELGVCSVLCSEMVGDMLRYVGKKTTVMRVIGRKYSLSIDDGEWTWSNCMLEPVTKRRNKQPRNKLGQFVGVDVEKGDDHTVMSVIIHKKATPLELGITKVIWFVFGATAAYALPIVYSWITKFIK